MTAKKLSKKQQAQKAAQDELRKREMAARIAAGGLLEVTGVLQRVRYAIGSILPPEIVLWMDRTCTEAAQHTTRLTVIAETTRAQRMPSAWVKEGETTFALAKVKH